MAVSNPWITSRRCRCFRTAWVFSMLSVAMALPR
jgi:hypothetical protein